MITINVSALPEGPWFHNGQLDIRFDYQESNDHVIPGYLISVHDMIPSETVEIGPFGHLIQSKKAWGKLKDKGVKHLRATGELSLSLISYIVGYTGSGFPKASDGNTEYVFRAICGWGSSQEHNLRYFPAPYSTGGHLYECIGGVNGFQRVRFYQDKCLIALERYHGGVLRDGLEWSDEYTTTWLLKYRRTSSGLLYYMGNQVVYSALSESDLGGILYSIPNSGGTLEPTIPSLESVCTYTIEQVCAAVTTAVQSQVRRLDLFKYTNPFVDYGTLALECADQMKYVDDSLLCTILDIAQWRMLQGAVKSFVDPRMWAQAASAFASVFSGRGGWSSLKKITPAATSPYLSGKYAVLPTISDYRRLLKGCEVYSSFANKQRLHSRKVTSFDYPGAESAEHTAVLTVQCSTFPEYPTGVAMKIIAAAKNWGIYPETIVLWDRLIFSFVIDWFIQFGDMLSQVDDYFYVKDYFPVEYGIFSEKWKISMSGTSMVPAGMQVTGAVDFSYYVRWIEGELPTPPVTLTADCTLDQHLVEATALVIQRAVNIPAIKR